MRARLGLLVIVTLTAFASGCASSGGTAARDVDELMDVGRSMARRGYWQEALDRYQRAEQLQPNRAEVINNLAVALEAVGRYEEALATYQRALELSPNHRIRRNFEDAQEFYQTNVKPPAKPAEKAEGEHEGRSQG